MFKRLIIALLLLLALALASWAIHGRRPASERDWVYDDLLVIAHNDFITHPANLLRLWGRDYLVQSGEQSYRPVVTATYIMDYALWGRSVRGFTFTNLAIQVLAAWLLGLVLFRALPKQEEVGASSALLYVLHPALIETATVPSNREQILSVLLLLVATWCWLSTTDARRACRWLSPLFLLLGCLTLEWCVVWPAVLFAWRYTHGDSWKKAACAVAPEVAVAAVFVVLWLAAFPRFPGAADPIRPSAGMGLWAFSSIFWRYIHVGMAPDWQDLSPSYFFVQPPFATSLVGLSALLLVVIAAVVGVFRRWRWSVGVLLVLLALLPVSHVLMPFWIPYADRYLALPLVGLLPLLGSLFFARRPVWGLLPLSVVAGIWFVGASSYAQIWRNNLTLWSNATLRQPQDTVSWTNYGAALLQVGNNERALEAHGIAWRLARKVGGERAFYVSNYAHALESSGRVAQACTLLKRNHERFPPDRTWLLDLARVCAGPDPGFAREVLAGWLKVHPNDCAAWNFYCFTRRGEIPACLKEWLVHCPDDPRLWLTTASAHAAVGDGEKCRNSLAVMRQKADPVWLKSAAKALPNCP